MGAPKRPKGLLVSEHEYEIVSQALVAIAEEAKKHGQTDAYATIRRFVVRLKQSIFNSDGVPPDTLQRMAEAVERGFANQDYEATQVAISAMLAAVIRQDHDPGHTIARVLAPSFIKLAQGVSADQVGKIGYEVLRGLDGRLKTERGAFVEHGWSDPPTTFDYIVKLVEFCAAELANGVDPFAPDPDDSEDPN